MRRSWTAMILLTATALACTGGGVVVTPDDDVPTRVDVDLGRDFAMGVRDTVHVEDVDVVLYFDRVGSDSRCPSDVQCPWSGDATVHLEVSTEDGETDPQQITLHTNLEPRSTSIMGVTIQLVYLNPYPRSTAPINPWSYEATILVTR